MKFPSELNPKIEEVLLPNGNTPIYRILLTFNGEEHCYEATEKSDFAAVNILLKAMEDGYGKVWTPPVVQDPVVEETPAEAPVDETMVEEPPTEEVTE